MAKSQEELRAKLIRQAEAAIDDLLKDERLHEGMTLSEIEQVVGRPGSKFRQGVLEEIMAIQQSRPTCCPRCGGKLYNKGKRRKGVVTIRGETAVERVYYQCQACGKGYFPPG